MIEKDQLLTLQSFDTEEEYRASNSLNYSLLKDLVNGPKALTEERSLRPSSALQIGSFVDMYYTNREKLYDVFSVDKPKIKLSDSFEQVYNHFANIKQWNPSAEEIVSVCKTLGLFAKMSDDVIKERIPAGLLEKLNNTQRTGGKILLSPDDNSKCFQAIDNIDSCSEATDLITELEGEIILHQFKLEFPLTLDSGRIRMFKVMLDFIKLNFNTLEMFGMDLKTGARASHKFYDQFVEYRYDLQGILYYLGLLALRTMIRERFGIKFGKPTSSNFKFLYSPKMQSQLPIIVSMNDDWIRLNGGEYFEHKGVRYPGFWKLVNDADWYIDNQEFSNHRVIAEKMEYNISQLSDLII
jgi:hypothetical protein